MNSAAAHPETACDAPKEGAASHGRLYLTISLLVDRSTLHERFPNEWNDALWRKAADARNYRGIKRTAQAIHPLFDDIADRARHLFSADTLLDAQSPFGTVGFALTNPTIAWSTEGNSFVADLDQTAFFGNTGCRCFWFLHSNGSLSYHISFDLEYGHSLAEYYAMSVIQKAVFSSEGTDWVNQDKGLRLLADGKTQALWPFIEERFERDAAALFKQLGLAPGGHADYWRALICAPPIRGEASATDHRAAARRPYQCRAIFLFEDKTFFEALNQPTAQRAVEVDPTPFERNDGEQVVYESMALARLGTQEKDKLKLVFLAGFLRNIIDFLRQDGSEVADGTDAVYPSPDDAEFADPRVLVFANQHSVFEVVENSRSLEAGRDYIGNCPYLFLVHIMAFHDEALVMYFEQTVKDLVVRLERMGLRPEGYSEVLKQPKKMSALTQTFQSYRVTMFAEVEKYLHLNVFRYDTEQAFYSAVQRARGLTERRTYWDGIMTRLGDTVDDIRETIRNEDQDRMQSEQARLNRIAFLITILSVSQLAVQLAGVAQKRLGVSPEEMPAEGLDRWHALLLNLDTLVLVALPLGVVCWLVYRLVRRLLMKLWPRHR